MSYTAEYHGTPWERGYPHGERFTRATLKRVVIADPNRIPGTWVTAEGVVMQIADMNNSHLRNTIGMLRRESLRKLAAAMSNRGTPNRDVIAIADYLTRQEVADASHDVDERAYLAWGDVHLDLLEEACYRSEDGDVERWLAL